MYLPEEFYGELSRTFTKKSVFFTVEYYPWCATEDGSYDVRHNKGEENYSFGTFPTLQKAIEYAETLYSLL